MSTSLTAMTGMAEASDRYDAFILDLWGVIHDGQTAYPGVRETLLKLKAAGKRTILLSNAPRRVEALYQLMEGMGLERELFGDAMSSGEATREALINREGAFFGALGHALYHIGPERDVNIFEGLSGYRAVQDIQTADFILNTGPVDLSHGHELYAGALDAAAARQLPMICANPDRYVIRAGERVMCAGVLADHYVQRGQNVAYFGKPDPAIYEVCLEHLGMTSPDARRKVAVVGDSLETDVAGGNAVGVDVIWCTGGIHAEALKTSYGQPADPAEATQLAEKEGHKPVAIIPGFGWC